MKLKLLVIGLLILTLVATAACNSGSAQEVTTTTSKPISTTKEEYVPPDDSDWISPGKVNIANFRPGATAEYPVTIHNGSDGVTVEVKSVTTDAGETFADIPINETLAYPNLFSDVKLSTDNKHDKLSVTGAKEGYLTISGFAPAENRKLTIEYIALTEFKVYYKLPTRIPDGFSMATAEQSDWILIADMTPIFLPRETKDILISLSMPAGVTAPGDKWEFWIAVTRSGQGSIETELVSRWQVAMRK